LDALKEASDNCSFTESLMDDGGDSLTAGETKFHDIRKFASGIVHRNMVCNQQTFQGF